MPVNPGCAAESEWTGGVGQDDLVPPGPAEEPPQHVGVLMPARGLAGKEILEVGGGDLGPPGQASANGGQVLGEVAQDPEPGRQGEVAELVAPGAPVAVPLIDLGVVECGDRRPAAVAVWRRGIAAGWPRPAAVRRHRGGRDRGW